MGSCGAQRGRRACVQPVPDAAPESWAPGAGCWVAPVAVFELGTRRPWCRDRAAADGRRLASLIGVVVLACGYGGIYEVAHSLERRVGRDVVDRLSTAVRTWRHVEAQSLKGATQRGVEACVEALA
jgi:hypothetical protein